MMKRGTSGDIIQSGEQAGFVSIEMVVAFAFSLLILTTLTNLILVQYGRGILRAAVDESARAGARIIDNDPTNANSMAKCKQRQDDVLKGIGKLASVTASSCKVVNGQVQSSVTASFDGWLPGIPTFSDTATAISVKEKAPQ
jgi:hypothetical protein